MLLLCCHYFLQVPVPQVQDRYHQSEPHVPDSQRGCAWAHPVCSPSLLLTLSMAPPTLSMAPPTCPRPSGSIIVWRLRLCSAHSPSSHCPYLIDAPPPLPPTHPLLLRPVLEAGPGYLGGPGDLCHPVGHTGGGQAARGHGPPFRRLGRTYVLPLSLQCDWSTPRPTHTRYTYPPQSGHDSVAVAVHRYPS